VQGGVSTTVVLDANARPLTGAVQVAQGSFVSGGGHACALLEDGSVQCWRERATGNSWGQLGNGNQDADGPTFRATPVVTAGGDPLGGARLLSSGYALATCAVLEEGSLYCWGELSWVVNGGEALVSAHAQAVTTDGLSELQGVVQASLGESLSCAVLEAGSGSEVWCWGYNVAGELGQGDTKSRQYPVLVPGFEQPTQVAVLASAVLWNNTVCALDGGRVRCLGYNGNGQVGAGSTESRIPAPALVKRVGGEDMEDMIELRPGHNEFCALHSKGSLWCWGLDYGVAATNVGASGVVSIAGDLGGRPADEPRYLTGDGKYHIGTKTTAIDCGSLQ